MFAQLFLFIDQADHAPLTIEFESQKLRKSRQRRIVAALQNEITMTDGNRRSFDIDWGIAKGLSVYRSSI